jgi:hypothetical protein
MEPMKLSNDNSASVVNNNGNFRIIQKSDLPQTIKIKYFDPDMPRMEITVNGDWIDCRAAKDYDLDPDTFNLDNDPILIDL